MMHYIPNNQQELLIVQETGDSKSIIIKIIVLVYCCVTLGIEETLALAIYY